MFRALMAHREEGGISTSVEQLKDDALPEGEVLISVAYSGINYKDGLAVTGKGKIIRGDFPFVPGIDLAGTVEESNDPHFKAGQSVILTGGGLGEVRWGGFSSRQRVDSTYLVPLPAELDPLAAMTVGTAGLTAMLSVMTLGEHGVAPSSGTVLVTGASGGVGSIAVAILARRGYDVTASTGKREAHTLLRDLGAASILGREALSDGPSRPLDSARWSGAVDSVGGSTLSTVLSQTGPHGAVAACGNAAGAELVTTVFPFILRGVNLLGIDSNYCSRRRRIEAWDRIAKELTPDILETIRNIVVPLDGVPDACDRIVSGKVLGRIVVDVNG